MWSKYELGNDSNTRASAVFHRLRATDSSLTLHILCMANIPVKIELSNSFWSYFGKKKLYTWTGTEGAMSLLIVGDSS